MKNNKNKKKKRYSSWRKSTIMNKVKKLRGGFSVPGGYKRPPTLPYPKLPPGKLTTGNAQRVLNDIGKTYSNKNGTNTARNVGTLLDVLAWGITLNKIRIGLTRLSSQFPGSKRDKVPFKVSSKVSRMTGTSGAFTAKKYSTSYTVGRPPTKSVKTAAALYGTYKKTKLNTIADYISSDEANVNRTATAETFGFNQKCFVFFESQFCTRVEDWLPEFGLQGTPQYIFPAKSLERIYGLALDSKVSWKFSNSNQYFPMKMKLHLIRHKQSATPPGFSTSLAVFNSSIDSDQNQSQGKIPLTYQYSVINDAGNHRSVVASPKARLTMASRFREEYDIISTFSKKLNPGDIWQVTINELYGSGIDVQMLDQMSSQDPVFYSYILEVVGTQCEGVQQSVEVPETLRADFTELGTYIGTSPGEFNYECTRTITAVNFPVTEFSFTDDTEPIQIIGYEPQAAIKVFKKKESLSKDFNVDYADIGYPGEEGKTLFIPVVSDKELRFAGSADSGSSNNSTTVLLKNIRNMLSEPLSYGQEEILEPEMVVDEDENNL